MDDSFKVEFTQGASAYGRVSDSIRLENRARVPEHPRRSPTGQPSDELAGWSLSAITPDTYRNVWGSGLWSPVGLAGIIEPMFDRARSLKLIESRSCACTGCAGQLTDAARSRGGWGFCRECRCAWMTSTIDGHVYATMIPSPAHAGAGKQR